MPKIRKRTIALILVAIMSACTACDCQPSQPHCINQCPA